MALRSAVGMALVAVLLFGCGAGPGATASLPVEPSPSAPAGSPSAPPPAPTDVPTATPAPSSTAVCASDLETNIASVQELADPSCYGDTELTIDGWLAESGVWSVPGATDPEWTNPWTKLYGRPPTTDEFIIDFLHADQVPGGVDVVTQPTTGIDLSGNGRWVRLRGHFNDAEASACTTVVKNGTDRDCPALFVVTGLENLPPDSPACPAESPMTLETFLAADARCFRGHDVQIRGWEDIGEGFGGTGPIWRVDEEPGLRMAKAQLASNRFQSGDLRYIFVWTVAGSGFRFDHEDRQIVATVRLGHPASKDCRPAEQEGWTWSPPVTWAQHYCERMPVITGIRGVD